MKLSACNALAAACLAVAAGPVFADAYSTVTVGKVTVTLIDLDPNDGIAAGISFLPEPGKFHAGASISGVVQTGETFGSEPGNNGVNFAKASPWYGSGVSATGLTPMATVSASVTGSTNAPGFAGLDLSGSALSTVDQRGYFFGEAFVPGGPAMAGGGLSYVLSANTKVVFSVDAFLSVNTTLGYTAGALSGENATANMSLYTGGLAADGTLLEDLQQRGVSVFYVDGTAPGAAEDSWSGVMSSSFSNLSNHSSNGLFWANANIRGESVISAVPEPSSYGMFLVGLGVIGSLARRRRNRAE
jgi:hypothetical protein